MKQSFLPTHQINGLTWLLNWAGTSQWGEITCSMWHLIAYLRLNISHFRRFCTVVWSRLLTLHERITPILIITNLRISPYRFGITSISYCEGSCTSCKNRKLGKLHYNKLVPTRDYKYSVTNLLVADFFNIISIRGFHIFNNNQLRLSKFWSFFSFYVSPPPSHIYFHLTVSSLGALISAKKNSNNLYGL